MGRLYPRMNERPLEFRINYASPLWPSILILHLGPTSVSPPLFKDYGPHNRPFTALSTATDMIRFDPVLRRFVTEHKGSGYGVYGGYASRFGSLTVMIWQWPNVVIAADAFGPGTYNIGAGHYPPSIRFIAESNQSLIPRTVQQWYHCVQTSDGTQIRRYIDSELVEETELSLNPYFENCCVGGTWFFSAYTGRIGDGIILSRVLSASEIAALADPSNVDLRVGGVPLILPPRRRFWPVVSEQAIPKMVPWHLFQHVGV